MTKKLIIFKDNLSIQIIRAILYGLLIWLLPALVATLLWDVSTNQPAINIIWYNSVMGAVWSSNFALFAYFYFKNIKEKHFTYGCLAGITWYLMNFLLDFLVVVILLNLGAEAFLPGILVYINNFVLATMIGYLLKKKFQIDKKSNQ